MWRRSRPAGGREPSISMGASWPSSAPKRERSTWVCVRTKRAAKVVTVFSLSLPRKLGHSELLALASPAPARNAQGAAGPVPSRPFHGNRGASAAASGRPAPQAAHCLQAKARRSGRLRLFCKNNLTPPKPLPIQPHTDGVGAEAADAASGIRDDLETRSSLLRGGERGRRSVRAFGFGRRRLGGDISLRLRIRFRLVLLRGVMSPWDLDGAFGEGDVFPFALLFDNCIGRKRDVGGGVLAGLCHVGVAIEIAASG